MNPDVKLTQNFFKIGKVIGTVPMFPRNSGIAKKIISVLYLVVITVLTSVLFIISINDRQNIYKNMKLPGVVVDFTMMLSAVTFIITCRIVPLVHYKQFCAIEDNCNAIENCLSKVDFKVSKIYVILLYLRLCIWHFIYFAIHIYEFANRVKNLKSTRIWLTYLPTLLQVYHQLFVITCVMKINSFVVSRYEFLKTCLENILKGEREPIDSEEINKYTLDLNQIFYVSKQLFHLINNMNVIFRWQIFFVLTCTILETLNIINFIKHDQAWTVLVVDLAYGITFIISTINIITSCDNVESSAEKLLLTCYTNQETLRGTPLENEVLKFADILEKMLPKYTAGGFVTVNQNILSSLFSATLTYLIVLIQFELTL